MTKYEAEITRFIAWMRDNALTQIEVAAKLGVHHMYINRIVNLKAKPGQNAAMNIERLTKGYVRAVDLRPEDKTLKGWRYEEE